MARTVSVKLLKIDGTPIVGAVLPFDQMSGSYTSQSQQPPDRKLSSPTNSQGVASVLLWENATGLLPNYVRLTLPESDEPVDFAVPAGTGPLDLVSRLDPPGAGTQGTRIITGTVNHNDGTPWAFGVISVTLENFCYTSQAIYPAGLIQITLDANGSFIQSVFANGGATNDSLMRWELPNNDVFWVRIPAGAAPLTLSFLRGLAVDPPIPSPPPAYVTPVVTAATVLAMIENHNLNPAAHPGGIAGGVGGVSVNPVWEAFSWGDASPALIGSPVTGFIHSIAIAISTVFPPGTVLSLGVAGQPALFAAIPASEIGSYEFYPALLVVNAQPLLTISIPSGTTAGAGSVFIHYTTP